MAVTHKGRRGKKTTGGSYRPLKGKRRESLGSEPTLTKIGTTRIKTIRTRGGNHKTKVLVSEIANVFDPKTKKYSKSKIKSVVEAPANRHYIRRNIIVKGAVVDTDLGKAKITSRPGQDGTVNAVLE